MGIAVKSLRRQETGDRRQETGDRRQETGDRRQETACVNIAANAADQPMLFVLGSDPFIGAFNRAVRSLPVACESKKS
jgi:hypothetical protein